MSLRPDGLDLMFTDESGWQITHTVCSSPAAGTVIPSSIISDVITHDVDVSPLITRLPLGDAELWADELLRDRKRQDVREDIIRAGFDVEASAKMMFELYTRLDREAREARGR